MKNYIQLQKGISLDEFYAQYGSGAQCEEAVEKFRWPEGFQCPKCGGKRHSSYRRGVKIFQCSECRKQTTLTEGTIFHSTKLPLTKWFQAMYFLTQSKNNVSILELRRTLGVTYNAAWRVKHKLMQVMCEREETTRLSGRVETDDSYLGGELEDGKRGRGSENKVPFIAAVQTNKQNNPIRAVFTPVKTFSQEEILGWVSEKLIPGTTVVSDGLSCFLAVAETGCFHERHVVGKGHKSTKMKCFTWVNTILGNLKTAISGTYHAFDFAKYPHRYLGEYQYRFNRRFELREMLPRLIIAAVHTGSRPESLLRMAED